MSAALRRIGGDRAVAALQRLAAEVTVLPACHDQVASTEAAKESFGISEASPRWNGAWYSSNRQGWRMGTGNWAACRHASSASGEPARPPGAEESPDQEVPRSGDPSSVPVSGVLRHLPSSWLPYAQLSRLDKPIGTWLLAWPCFWSIALAAPPGSLPDARVMALFGAGAVLLRGAGCTVNDMWDRDLDRQVERTRHRPLAAGTLSLGQATGWLGVQLGAGLAVLVQLNPYSQLLGASSLVLVGSYPLMKRITGWPQAFLGLTFNWGALLGWAAVRGACEWEVVLPLYASGVCWTLVYDTIYAHQDKADDAAVGIKSTALTFGAHSRHYIGGFAAATVCLAAVAGHAAGCGVPFYLGVGAGASHLAWQVACADLNSPADCAAKFRSSGWYGAALFAGILADRALSL